MQDMGPVEHTFTSPLLTKLQSWCIALTSAVIGGALTVGAFRIGHVLKNPKPGVLPLLTTLLIIGALFMVPLSLAILWSAIRTLNARLLICRDGVQWGNGENLRGYAYLQIKRFRRFQELHPQQIVELGGLDLTGDDGRSFGVATLVLNLPRLVLPARQFKQLRLLLEDKFVRVLLSHVLSELECGRGFDFGIFKATCLGLVGKNFDAGWSQIRDFTDGLRPNWRGITTCRLYLASGTKIRFLESQVSHMALLKALVIHKCGATAKLATF